LTLVPDIKCYKQKWLLNVQEDQMQEVV